MSALKPRIGFWLPNISVRRLNTLFWILMAQYSSQCKAYNAAIQLVLVLMGHCRERFVWEEHADATTQSHRTPSHYPTIDTNISLRGCRDQQELCSDETTCSYIYTFATSVFFYFYLLLFLLSTHAFSAHLKCCKLFVPSAESSS